MDRGQMSAFDTAGGDRKLTVVDLSATYDELKVYDATSPTYISKVMKHKTTGKTVHVKIFPKSHKQAANEYKVLQYLAAAKSPHIITPVTLQTDEKGQSILICDALLGDEFFDYVGNGVVSEETTKVWFRQLALAVATIHKYGVAHRDIKPENIIKATDALHSPLTFLNFEFAVYAADDQEVKDLPATPHYVAPEVLVGNAIKRTGRTWRASDMWSMGVMLYQTLTNVYPFDDPDQTQLLAKVMAATYTYADDAPNLTGAARELIHGLLEEDISKRLTAEQMLRHPWFGALGAPPAIPAPPAGTAFVTPQATPQVTPRSSIQLGSAGFAGPTASAVPAVSLPPITESATATAAAPAPAPAAVVEVKAPISLVPSIGHPNPALLRRTVPSVPREYNVMHELIDGNFEVSYLQDVTDTTRYAMKIIKKGNTPRELKVSTAKFEKEYNALKLLMNANHINILPLLDVLEDTNQFSLVFSHCSGADLFEVMSSNVDKARFSEEVAGAIVRQVLNALVTCHKNNVTHRDIKPENLFYATRDAGAPLRLVNFESAVIAGDDDPILDLTIDLRYVAPEVLADMKRTGKTWRASDIWSTGVLLFTLLCGKLPFGGENNPDFAIQKTVIQAGVYEYPSDVKLSADATDLIGRMLQKDYTKRISAADAFAHPWIAKMVVAAPVAAPAATATAAAGASASGAAAAPAASADSKDTKTGDGAKKGAKKVMTPEEIKKHEAQLAVWHDEAIEAGFSLLNSKNWSMDAVDTVDDAIVIKTESGGEQFRMKLYYPKDDPHKREQFQNEAKGLTLAAGENICPLIELLDEDKFGCIVIPNIKENDDLFELLYKEPLRETQARDLCKQVFGALSVCHRNDVAHRDVKPENFIFTKNDVKDAPLLLCNFETCIVAKDDEAVGDGVVDFRFVAPEVLDEKQAKTGKLARASDMWSAGVILFAMVTAKLPFEGKTPKQSLKKVIAGVFDFPLGLPLTNQVKDLIGKLLEKDINKRLTVLEALAHPWFIAPEEQPANPKAEAARLAALQAEKEKEEKQKLDQEKQNKENEADDALLAKAKANEAAASDSKFDHMEEQKAILTLPTYPGASVVGQKEYTIVSVKADDDPECHELVVAENESKKSYLMKRYHKKGSVALMSSFFVICNKLFSNPHPNILSMTEQVDEFEALSVITPLPTGTDLFEILYRDPLGEEYSRNLMRDIFSALKHLHEARLCFRDVKPENLLFQTEEKDSKLLLTNFEHTILASDDTPVKSVVITPEFVAPEVIRDDVMRTGLTWRASDMWSAGVLFYIMLTGRVPFAGNTTKAILKKVMVGVYEFPPGLRMSHNAKDLLRQLIDKDHTKRLSAAEALQHPWFTKPSPVPVDDSVLDEKEDTVSDLLTAVPTGPETPEARKARKAREQQITAGALATAATCTIM